MIFWFVVSLNPNKKLILSSKNLSLKPISINNSINKLEESLPNGRTYSILNLNDTQSLDNTKEFYVPKGHYFMMGDNRDNSRDSRTTSVGMVPFENLIGRAERLFFSHNSSANLWQLWKWPFAIRYGRLGDGIL